MEEEGFSLPVIYKGEQREFEVKLLPSAYTYKLHVTVEGTGIWFEPDEERQYRAVLDNETNGKNIKPDQELIGIIAKELEAIFFKK